MGRTTSFKLIALALSGLFFPVITSEAYARYCNSPYCSMCNAMFGQIQTRNMITLPKAQVHISSSLQSTPKGAIVAILSSLPVKNHEVFYDLGCGDGTFLIEVYKKFGCRCIGIEKDPTQYKKARQKIKEAGFTSSQITILYGDVLQFNLEDANYVYMYQYPTVIRRFLRRIPSSSTILSYSHEIPGCTQWKVVRDGYTFYAITPDISD